MRREGLRGPVMMVQPYASLWQEEGVLEEEQSGSSMGTQVVPPPSEKGATYGGGCRWGGRFGSGRVREFRVDCFRFLQTPWSEAVAMDQVTSLFGSSYCRFLVNTYLFEIEQIIED